MTALFHSTFKGAATEPSAKVVTDNETDSGIRRVGVEKGFYFAGKGASETPSLGRLTSFFGVYYWGITQYVMSPPWEVGTLPDGIHPVVGIGISGVPPYGSVY
jgi:hypothetical protein